MKDKSFTEVAAAAPTDGSRAELDAFVDWFVAYWRTRGAELFRENLDIDEEGSDRE